MTLRKWFHLFWTTLLLGMLVSIGIGLILQYSDKEFSVMGLSAVGFNVLNMLLGGATISVLSQMGFFAYLIVRFIAAGIIRSKTVWDLLQLAVVIVVLFDLVYLRMTNFEGTESVLSYSILPAIILLISIAVAYWKVKMTNRNAFIPTLFFMCAVTVLEAVPALKLDNAASSLFMLAPLLVCNAWQILILHKILDNKKS
ncbi:MULTISPECIES: KinB-signaling pathway activation protein [unclassified Paenibacillus]|uniref:KinB-signaling pathway activation protein n=1 Tax=unclassified Paenibacillus TaxID=185978 RepID=UPI00070E60B4|nr:MULTISPECIES: KinB-signaling pathway activation protein [unclassified Paenibacillus]KQX56032.1 KinB signaling pathway activation protein [Paenibacillus sp. Root444D2]KRE44391.1 KinB signaling pathway activation protein [Paenibacillus sp. Soil724D2]